MQTRTKKCIKVVLILVTIAMISKVSYDLKWFDVLIGIFKLESNPQKIQGVSLKSLGYMTLVVNEVDFLHLMSKRGWIFIKHYGRGMIFEKEGYEILVIRRNYFNRYAYYEVTTKEIFEAV